MKTYRFLFILLLALVTVPWAASPLKAQSPEKIDREARKALKYLYDNNPKAREIGGKAVAVLVFPNVIKAGFIFGASGGNGALISNGQTMGYYNTTSVSYGLQAGAQKFGYCLFFMNQDAMAYLHESEGWEVGAGPSIVIVDTGAAKSLSTTTLQKDIYAFVFDQKGLMAGIGIQGSKITEYFPSAPEANPWD